MIVVVGLSHKTAPIDVRERLAIGRDALPDVLRALLACRCVAEAVVLSTCNRVEVYAAPRAGAPLDDVARAVVTVLARIGGDAVASHLLQAQGPDAVRHLFRVAASLDSLVVGEPQVLGQLKEAIQVARAHKAIGALLGKAMHLAVRSGKRVRSETAIGSGQVSVSSVAVDLARQIFGDLEGHAALLIGAGEMAEAAAKLLQRAGARLSVVNRSTERADALAAEVGGSSKPWTALERCLIDADIVISSTASPGPVVSADLVKRLRKPRRGRSLFLIDIAVPRDVDPAVNDLDGVYLYDVDDLSQIVARSLEGRAAEAERAEAIVLEEAARVAKWTHEQALTPTIVGLRERTRAVLAAELERSLSGKLRHLAPGDREALAVMLDAATNKLLHTPVARLRAFSRDERGADYVDALREIFDLPSGAQDMASDVPPRPGPEVPAAATSVPPPASVPARSPSQRSASPPPSGTRGEFTPPLAEPGPALRSIVGGPHGRE